jgi:hypothetical protein
MRTIPLARQLPSALLVLSVLTASASCRRSEVVSRQPNIPAGGRAVAIAVRPDNEQRILVASETGGVFRTFNGGSTWIRSGSFPAIFLHDVDFASLGPEIVLATTRARFRTVSDGGIWRSTNGGDTWAQPAGALPAASRNCPSRPSAYEISFQPLTRTVWVATDCGLSRSDDNGITWRHILLDSAAARRSDSLQHRVWSVNVLNRTSGVAAADVGAGLWHLDGTGTWRRAQSGPPEGFARTFHAFAGSPASASHWFHVGRAPAQDTGRAMWMSVDGGANWSTVATPAFASREPFIRSARATTGDDRTYDLYLGTGIHLFRQTFTHADSAPLGSGQWKQLTVDHADPADIAFDLERRMPILLATDGGLHKTTNAGASWTFSGGGPAGYNALQITEVIGQEVGGRTPHLDLYFGTQDNFIWGSPDGGATWPRSHGGEGFFLQVAPQSTDHDDARFTGAACGNCSTFQSREHLTSVADWPDPPDNDTIPPTKEFEGVPFFILPDAYLQSSIHNDSTNRIKYFLTLSAGAAWARKYELLAKPRGFARFAGSRANPTVFQGHRFDQTLPQGGFRYALFRIPNLATTPQVQEGDSAGIGALGVLKTMFAFYTVFGVDPNHPERLIAPDLLNGGMRISRDGGRNWQAYPALTAAVTDSGRFREATGDEPLASVIAFDPYDSCHIIIATEARGILRSTDGGDSWRLLRGSTVVTYPTSVYFPRTGNPWVSTYGRGLWQLRISRRGSDGNCAFVPSLPVVNPVDTIIVLDPVIFSARPFRSLGDACPTCEFVTVHGGWFSAVDLAGDTLRGVAVSSGLVAHVDTAGRERPPRIGNRYALGEWRPAARQLAERLRPPLRARALGVEGNRLRAIIATADALPFPPPRYPTLQLSGTRAGSGNDVASDGERLRVQGSGWLPSRPGGTTLQLTMDGVVVAGDVGVRADGSFTAGITLRGATGHDVRIAAEQRDGVRVTRVEVEVRVVPGPPVGPVLR